jgi:hypothetical protein
MPPVTEERHAPKQKELDEAVRQALKASGLDVDVEHPSVEVLDIIMPVHGAYGLVYDSGERRNGQIVWKLRVVN